MFLFNFVDALVAMLYGIVEGISEWLPISSTGHLILLDAIFDKAGDYGQEFWKFFLVFIQFGAILAVVVTFFKKLWPFSKNKTEEEKKSIWHIWLNIVIACIPAVIMGLIFEVTGIDDKLDNNAIIVAITLILYGILFIVLEIFNKKREFKLHDLKDMPWKLALYIGLIQLLSLIPGTSRSGVTILGAMLLGCDRAVSLEFSFFLSIPIMIGASLLKGASYGFKMIKGDVLKPQADAVWFLVIATITSFVVSILVINLVLKYIRNHDFIPFGVYRIILGTLVLILFATKVLTIKNHEGNDLINSVTSTMNTIENVENTYSQ